MWHALQVDDLATVQVLFAFKMNYSEEAMKMLVDDLFDGLNATKVCLISEASLALSAINKTLTPAVQSCLIIDIGATCTTVCPIYFGMILRNAMKVMSVGGESCTDMMEMLLDKHQQHLHPEYSSQIPRRRKQIARQVKHQTAFVVDNFENAVARYGGIEYQQMVQVMNISPNSIPISTIEAYKSINVINQNKEIEMVVNVDASSGKNIADNSCMSLTVACERFYCMEVLFDPNLKRSIMRSSRSLKATSSVDAKDKDVNYKSQHSGITNAIAGVKLVGSRQNSSSIPTSLNNNDDDNQLHDDGCDDVDAGAAAYQMGLIPTILSTLENIKDADCRKEMISNILIGGHSAVVPGLCSRIRNELIPKLKSLYGISEGMFNVRCMEEVNQSMPTTVSSKGASQCMSKAIIHSNNAKNLPESQRVPLLESNVILHSDYDSVGATVIASVLCA
jgi:actin-related protein